MMAKALGFLFLSTFGLVLAAGCGSDDGGTPTTSPTPHDPVPVGFKAVALAADGFLSSNAGLVASLVVLAPEMGATFRRVNSDPAHGRVVQQSCIPSATQDKVYKYNTGTGAYEPTMDPGAPPGGTRFTLYELDASGDPLQPLDEHEIGFFDIHCEGQLPGLDSLTIWLVNTIEQPSGVTVLNLVLKGSVDPGVTPAVFDFQRSVGVLHDPGTGNTMDIATIAQGTVGSELADALEITGGLEVFDSRLAGFSASASRWDASLGTSGLPEPPLNQYKTSGAMRDASGTEVFTAAVEMSVDGGGVIVNVSGGDRAPLEFIDEVGSGSGILACFSDGYADPLIEHADTEGGCATGSIDTPIPQSVEALDSYFDGHKALMDLLNVMAPVYGICVGVLTP
jgi:hypothetical protein